MPFSTSILPLLFFLLLLRSISHTNKDNNELHGLFLLSVYNHLIVNTFYIDNILLWKVIKLVYFVQRMLTLLEEKLKYLRRHTHRHVYNEEKDQLGNTFTWTKCALKTVKEYKKDACPQLSIWFQLRSKATLRTDVSFSANHTSNQVIHSLHRNTTHLCIKLNVQKVIRTLLSVCCNIFVMITYHNLWHVNKCLESHNCVFFECLHF